MNNKGTGHKLGPLKSEITLRTTPTLDPSGIPGSHRSVPSLFLKSVVSVLWNTELHLLVQEIFRGKHGGGVTGGKGRRRGGVTQHEIRTLRNVCPPVTRGRAPGTLPRPSPEKSTTGRPEVVGGVLALMTTEVGTDGGRRRRKLCLSSEGGLCGRSVSRKVRPESGEG